ncbi:hypothetical protein [Mucilaginibacter sp.]|uniref:hypothetical protein n=1 Tax=Mucilaginibacter sp. TaxID=1882438 RepID=UPI003D0A8EF9
MLLRKSHPRVLARKENYLICSITVIAHIISLEYRCTTWLEYVSKDRKHFGVNEEASHHRKELKELKLPDIHFLYLNL